MQRAERVALHVGRPAAIGFDNLVTEPSKDKLKGGEEPERGHGEPDLPVPVSMAILSPRLFTM